MTWLHALLPAVEAHAIHDRLTRMGKTMVGRRAGDPDADPRSLDQVRADILCDLLIDGGTRINGTLLLQPPSSNPANAGARVALLGTLWLMAITALTAIPIGIGAAIYLEDVP